MADHQSVIPHSERIEAARRESQYLGLGGRAGPADALDTGFGELPKAPALRLLIAKGRPDVREPQWQRAVLKVVYVRSHDRGGVLRPQAELAIPMGKRVHPGGDLFPGLAQEQVEVLDDRGLDAPVAVKLENSAQGVRQAPQTSLVGRDEVIGAANRLDFERFHTRSDFQIRSPESAPVHRHGDPDELSS